MTISELLENETIELNNGIVLKKGTRNPRQGINALKELRWVYYSIEGKFPDEWKSYDGVLFMPYCIDKSILHGAEEHVYFGGVSKGVRPNIDGNTGNIHPEKQPDFNKEKDIIKQLVLVAGSGPMNNDMPVYEPHYYYEDKTKKCFIPQACYYPLIDTKDKEQVEKSFGYKFLKAIWTELIRKGEKQ